MKSRLLLLAIFAVGGMALYCGIARPTVSVIPGSVRESLDDLKPVAIPAPEPPPLVIATPNIVPPPLPVRRIDPILGQPEVPIQDATTIDFSTGGPQIKTQGKDQAALEQALKEIAESTKDVSIKPVEK
jgi:hypothetical protein